MLWDFSFGATVYIADIDNYEYEYVDRLVAVYSAHRQDNAGGCARPRGESREGQSRGVAGGRVWTAGQAEGAPRQLPRQHCAQEARVRVDARQLGRAGSRPGQVAGLRQEREIRGEEVVMKVNMETSRRAEGPLGCTVYNIRLSGLNLLVGLKLLMLI